MQLGVVLEKWRWAQKITFRDAAKSIGISYPTLNRIERGEAMDGKTLARILQWLFSEDQDE